MKKLLQQMRAVVAARGAARRGLGLQLHPKGTLSAASPPRALGGIAFMLQQDFARLRKRLRPLLAAPRAATMLAFAFLLVFAFVGCSGDDVAASSASTTGAAKSSVAAAATGAVSESGEYTDKDSVALYIHLYGHLPGNYVSKTKARKAGWVNTEGNLWDVLPGKSIGGSEFYDDDDQLPDAPGRRWTECDIDYNGGYRNAKRIVFSNDGLVFYTEDHYNTFEQLY